MIKIRKIRVVMVPSFCQHVPEPSTSKRTNVHMYLLYIHAYALVYTHVGVSELIRQ